MFRDQNAGRSHSIEIDNRPFERVEEFKYLVTTLTNKNSIQGIHKRMARFQKVTRNLFVTLHGHNVHRQQRQLSKFLMRYQQFASHA